MKKQLKQIEEFANAFNDLYSQEPNFNIPEEKKKLRIMLMKSELEEVIDAIENGNIYSLAHELGDLMYTVLGTVGAFGLGDKFEEIFDEIHRSNMSKLGSDGKPILTPEGKAIKSQNFKKADMHKVLDK